MTQLQVGLGEHGWWVNLYMDDKPWLEQRNLLSKIESPSRCRQWLEYLQDLMKSGYELYLYPAGTEISSRPSPPKEFAAELQTFHRESRRSLTGYCRYVGSWPGTRRRTIT